MNTLDIIKYISFRQKNSKVLTIILLPVAIAVVKNHVCYHYNIVNKDHISFINKIIESNIDMRGLSYHIPKSDESIPGYHMPCNIRTVFGKNYKGRIQWLIYLGDIKVNRSVILDVTSDKVMEYEENYYLRSINCNKRFSLMEVDNVY